jgi:hypothetical protein
MTWATILIFPRGEAGKGRPRDDATLRSAVTASSRPMMTATIQAGTRSICTREMNAADVSSLSASGSIIWPSAVICPRRRARYPSSQSVIEASAKIAAATSSLRIPKMSSRSNFVSSTTTSSGTRKMRVTVSAFGRFI